MYIFYVDKTTRMKRKAVFIINLKSGTSDKAAIPDIIASTLDRDKFDYEIAITQYAGHASEIAEKANNWRCCMPVVRHCDQSQQP